MKCHYDVLCITKEASSSEIKKAYRKLALQWHPDKNLDKLQEAKEQFQLIQNAYEVLSDPQERSWYDNHREQLLRGAGSSYNDDSLDVYPYFSPSCYKGFTDEPQGFYGVYSEVFSKLASEETDFLDDPEDVAKIPKFGNSTTPYEEVHEFYAFWMAFSTNKSYVWLDQYEISQGDNRRVIKLMEKENNKIRQKARKERNEEIRRLVSFVRRKDKRVIEHTKLLQAKVEENKRKAEQVRRERIMQRQKEIEEAKIREGETSFLQSEDYHKKLSEIESLLAEEFGLSSDDDTISEGGMESSNEESSKTEDASEQSKVPGKSATKSKTVVKNLYCSACNKLFKNINSFENHENSKKHKENVANMTLENDIDISDNGENDGDNASSGRDDSGNINGQTEEGENVGNSTSDIEDNDIRETLSDDSDKVQALPKSQKKKKNKKKSFIPMPESEGNDSHDEMSFNEIEGPARSRKAKKFNMLKSQIQAKKEANLKKGSQSQTSTENLYEVSSTTPTDDALGEAALPRDRVLPKMQRNIKPKKLTERKPVRTKTSETEDSSTALTLRCAICQTDFPSKNKLFEHLKKTGHSVPLPHASFTQMKKGKRANR
ncbi:PREDICTED: dnaJ homolog subfamily C member 21 isoform X2 [Papilio polytes]|uniref:dnaJ homolog subfamily C member 21 isoform X2 n=1 Tax=Papilio polytes TaxID=76194 RepID=UPI000675D86A|nr:PREDICTED: dnaJ homolog subfamily C member 21 isoform X2 [Papilio polytes]